MLKKINAFIIVLPFLFFLYSCVDYKKLEEERVNKYAEYKQFAKQNEEIKKIVLTHQISSLSGMDTIDKIFGLELHIEKSMGNEVLLGSWEITKIDNTDNMYLAKLFYYINGVKMYKSAVVNILEKKVTAQNFSNYYK